MSTSMDNSPAFRCRALRSALENLEHFCGLMTTSSYRFLSECGTDKQTNFVMRQKAAEILKSTILGLTLSLRQLQHGSEPISPKQWLEVASQVESFLSTVTKNAN